MDIIFDKYIDNPSITGAVFTNRSMYKQMYKDKFGKVLVREQGKIDYTLYKANDKIDSHYIHFKIPSEVIPDFYYDVVIQLYTTDNKFKNEASLRRYFVKFYSNDPAFVYTFAHAFIANKIFIEDLRPKMSKEAIRHTAKVRNPKDDVWYVKSLFFAYLAMEKYNLFNKSYYTGSKCKKYNKKELLSKITQAEIKVKDRQNAEEDLKKAEKVDKEKKDQKRERSNILPNNISSNIKQTKITGMVGKTKKVNTVKRSKITSTGKGKRH